VGDATDWYVDVPNINTASPYPKVYNLRPQRNVCLMTDAKANTEHRDKVVGPREVFRRTNKMQTLFIGHLAHGNNVRNLKAKSEIIFMLIGRTSVVTIFQKSIRSGLKQRFAHNDGG